MIHFRRKEHYERGFAVPAIAVVCGLVVTALFALGIDSLMIKMQQRRLRSAVDWACKRTVRHLPITRRASEQLPLRLRDALKSSSLLSTNNITFTNITVVLPTMPANGRFDPADATRYTLVPGAPTLQILPTPLNTSTPAANQYYQTQQFSNSLGRSAINVFPPIGDDMRDANDVAGCVVEAQISSPFFTSIKLSVIVKSAFRSAVRGPGPLSGVTPAATCAGETATPGEATRSGLTIAIGTELFTNALDPRFRFTTSAGSTATYDATFQLKYDPLRAFVDTGVGQVRRFYKGMPEPYTTLLAVPAQAVDFSNTSHTQVAGATPVARVPANLQTEVDGAAPTSTEIPSDEEEMLVACSNPLILVRNTFLATIVELASRHGDLRDSTEILSLNPVAPPAVLTPSVSMPSTIVRFGQDLALRLYQIPFVFYRDTSGLVDAFNTGVNKNLYSMLASQLRWCFHLYDGAGIKRYAEEPLLTDLNNTNYEPQAVFTVASSGGRAEPYIFPNSTPHSPYTLRTAFTFPTPAPTISKSTPRPWSQSGAWCGGKPGADNAACTPVAENLTAAEVVSALGSTQYCPDGNLTGGSPLCAKPLVAAATANPMPYPDLKGFLSYAKGDSCTARSISAPGFYPIPTLTPLPALPMISSAYSSAKNINSHILLVLHYVPTTSGLSSLFQSVARVSDSSYSIPSGAAPRPITIALFPPTCQDLASGLTNLQAALGVSNIMNVINSSETNPTLRVLVFSPYFTATGAGACVDTAAQEVAKHQQYWATLLTDSDRNIVNIAETVFSTRLTRPELIN